MAEGHGTRINAKPVSRSDCPAFFVIAFKLQVCYGLQFVNIDKNDAFEYLLLTESEFYAIIIWS